MLWTFFQTFEKWTIHLIKFRFINATVILEEENPNYERRETHFVKAQQCDYRKNLLVPVAEIKSVKFDYCRNTNGQELFKPVAQKSVPEDHFLYLDKQLLHYVGTITNAFKNCCEEEYEDYHNNYYCSCSNRVIEKICSFIAHLFCLLGNVEIILS